MLERWPVADRIETDAFTTVANFRAYGSIEQDGVRYGQKAHSLRALLGLPTRTDERFALALDIHPDEPDLAALREHGWELLDPRRVAGSPDDYAAFVRGSKAEIGIAKEGYVVSRCGWFGDRSAAYLASGRPVVAQDTGFGERLPIGAGLFAFAGTDDVLAAIEAIRFDYGRHARAARAIAEEHLDSRLVLTRLLRELGLVQPAPHRSIHDATDAELAELLGATPTRRRPFEYRSSAPLVELEAGGEDAAAQGSLAAGSDRPGSRRRSWTSCTTRVARSRCTARCSTKRVSARRRSRAPSSIPTAGGTGSWSRRWPGTELYQARDRPLGTGGSVARAAA